MTAYRIKLGLVAVTFGTALVMGSPIMAIGLTLYHASLRLGPLADWIGGGE